MVENFTAHITPFGLDRNTFVYLPDDWQSSGRRYPVVYMFDGHNLFFDSTATYGTCWGLKEYMDAHPQAIIVAPECNHEGNARLEEYSPYDFVWQEYDIKGRGKALEVTNLLTARGATVYPYCQLDGRHCEADWRRQLGRCFTFLFGWR